MSDTGNMDGKGEDDRVLVAEYVLGLLPANEHAAVTARLAADPALRAEHRLWRLRLQSLDAQFEEVAAPAGTWPRIESRLFAEQRRSGGLWESLAFWRGLAAAGALVAVIAIGANVLTPRVDPKLFAEQLVAALADQGQGVSFVALYDPMTGSVRLTSLSGAEVPDKDYELWAIEEGAAPISMGVVHIEQHQSVKIAPEIMRDFGAGTVLAVTLEAKGGSPTGAPQGPVVAAGAATPI